MQVDVGYQADVLKPPMRFFSVASRPLSFRRRRRPAPISRCRGPITSRQTSSRPSGGEVDINDSADRVCARSVITTATSTINIRRRSSAMPCRAPQHPPGAFQLGGLRRDPFAGSGDVRDACRRSRPSRDTVDTGPVNHAVNVNYSINDRTYHQQVVTPFGRRCRRHDLTGTCTTSRPILPKPNFTFLAANQLTGVTLSSVGISDTMSLFNKRIQFTVGVRHQTAGSEVHELSSRQVPAAGRIRRRRC